MLTRWNDFGLSRWGDLGLSDLEDSFQDLNALRRDLDRWAADFDRQFGGARRARAFPHAWPRMSLHDAGSALHLRVDVPGFAEEDIQLSVDGSTITISGERKVDAPEGYAVHRRERGDLSFSRSATLPMKVDAEKAKASLKNGVLEISLPKAPEAQPKQIAVRSG